MDTPLPRPKGFLRQSPGPKHLSHMTSIIGPILRTVKYLRRHIRLRLVVGQVEYLPRLLYNSYRGWKSVRLWQHPRHLIAVNSC